MSVRPASTGSLPGEGEDVGRSLERSGAEKQDTDAGGWQCSFRPVCGMGVSENRGR